MSIQEAAQAATIFPNVPIITPQGTYPLPVVMVAIAGAESNFREMAKGDFNLGGPTCDGSTSWGLWQIHNTHSAYLTAQSGSTNPCTWEAWCFDPNNNAKAALAVIQGYSSPTAALKNAWYTTWNNQSYVKFLSQAQTYYKGASTTPTVQQGVTTATASDIAANTTKYVEYGIIGLVGIMALVVAREVLGVIHAI